MPRRKKTNPFADMPGDLRRAVAACFVPGPKYCPPCGTSHPADYRCPHAQPVAADPVCSYAVRGLACRNARAGEQCGCNRSPAVRTDELYDVLGMLLQADADLTGLRPETAQQTLRDAIGLLRSELPPSPQDAYKERVAKQTARIDAHLNEEGRKPKRKR